ncbi:MAG: sodium:solute symporter family protein [Vicinamibacterales bacterium]
MNIHLVLLIVYSLGIVAMGLWTARFIRQSADFFVAGRSLGPGLILSSMLASNIGAGSTVGVASFAYRDGISTWWWVGAAGLASLVFAFWAAPPLWRLAKAHNFYTTGDYLEFRFGPSVRATVAALICVASLSILAGQLIAGAAILNVIIGIPFWAGSLVGASIMTVYFTAGGLLGTAWVNTVQLVIMLVGFLIALPVAIEGIGGLDTLTAPPAPPWFGDFFYSAGPGSGWTLFFLTFPAFICSPGLIQKGFGARDERALTRGIAGNGIALMLFAFVPTLLGMAGRVTLPEIGNSNLVLPTVLLHLLPAWLGALALSAVFSTEVDTCDAVLFMLSTTMSKDIYQRHINPQASDQQLLLVARAAAVLGGTLGVILSITLGSVTTALTIFYQVLACTLFVPILAGIFTRRGGAAEALGAIVAGNATLFIIAFTFTSRPRWLDPSLVGITAAALAYGVVNVFRKTESKL